MCSNNSRNNTSSTNLEYSIVVPVFNSEKMLAELNHRILALMEYVGENFEIIYVEDCGSDNAWDVICDLAENDPRVVAVQMMNNSGQGNATLAGIKYASGNFIITMDDDLQHPPEELPKLINSLLENSEVDVVIGVPKIKRHGLIRRLGSSLINTINSLLLDKPISLKFTGFRIMRRQVADLLVEMQVPYPALGPMIVSITKRIINIPINHEVRYEGKSNYNITRIIKQTLSNFIGYSMLPLRILAYIGSVGIVISSILGIFYLIRFFITGSSVAGWTTLLLVLLGLMGFNFYAFAIIGEYLLRIFTIQMKKSDYYVRQFRRN